MAITTCFSSNLGAKALECNPQDVTGTQRYKFFATALGGNGNKGTSLTSSSSSNTNQEELNSPSSSKSGSKRQKRTKNVTDQNRNNNDQPLPCFQESCTQTNDVKVLPSLPSSSSSSTSNEIPKLNKEQQLMAEIQLEKMAREKERKEQEAALPPVSDKQSLEAYRVFLEENEKKDFALREKELDERMKLKLKNIEENLYERYRNTTLLNQKKVELIRNNKLKSLKKKESALLTRERISDISNKFGQSKKQVKNTNSLDMIMHSSNTAMKSNRARSIKGQSYSRKAREDLELITAYFASNT